MNANTLYRKAVNVLKPSRAEMERRHAPYVALHNEAIAKLAAMKLTQADAIDLWQVMSLTPRDRETALDKEMRVILFGYARGTSKVGGKRDPINSK